MSEKLDDIILQEFKQIRAYGKLEERLLEDKTIAVNKLKTVNCFEIKKIVEYQTKIKYIEFLLRLVDSTKN